jgi:branched-chain amino acid transport system substrate-binding protein
VERRRRSVRKIIVFATVLVAAVAFTVPGALGGAEQVGITKKSVVIGGTFPLTGTAAAYAPIPAGMRAYFSYINSRRGPDGKRGVRGRQIVWKIYDDGYNPANTIQFTRRLVEEDKVFATVGQLGTEHNLAVRPYMNQRKVPQSLVSTGASKWGTEFAQYPWTTGWQPDYVSEARIYGLHIRANHAGKKIAVLYQNDDYGKDYLLGLRVALGKKYADENIIASEAFDVTSPTVQAQMARIRASGARVFVILATPTFTIQAYAFGKALGYNPDQIYLNSVSATAAFLNIAVQRAGAEYVNGSLSVTYLKDPSNPAQANDPAVQEYKRLMEKYAPGLNSSNQLYMYGFAKAETFVQTLYAAGKNPTRASYQNALLSMKNTKNRFLLNGVVQNTSKRDRFMISQQQLQRFNNGAWSAVGRLVEGRPR